MNDYGAWVQLLAFQCRMSRQRRAELLARLDGLMEHGEDHVVPIGPQADDILRFCLIVDVAVPRSAPAKLWRPHKDGDVERFPLISAGCITSRQRIQCTP